MTSAAQVTQAVSAMRAARAARSSSSEPASMTFLVFEDNGGAYRWTIVDGRGETVAQSASFRSYEEAKRAARIVHRRASSASLEGGSDHTSRLDLPARDAATARDRLDAERGLDEGGSFSREAVTR